MDRVESRFADADLAGLPTALDDNEIVEVGGPIWDVVKVEAIAPLTLSVSFEDGLSGIVRFERSRLWGVFEKLADPAYFARVGIAHGAVSWPNEEPDMAPDRMYDEIVAGNGEWIWN